MVLAKRICPPERRKALIAVSASLSSPTLSVSDPAAAFQLRISLRIAETTRPGQAVTICLNDTVFAPAHPEGGLDMLARGAAYLVSATEPGRRISLGHFRIHKARVENPASDLKDRPDTHLLTIPADGSVEVTHTLTVSRIFEHEERLAKDDVFGESWRFGLNEGYVGTTWWCWGDLRGDLANKHLSVWHEGMRPEIMPKPQVTDDWVFGCDPVELVFEDRTSDATFTFVA
ncbi:hypothetical protein AURDEDRAFT_147021 [Auricularia subglabra TFB-10046 SS5]|uniref:Uncharacterized protein n=1 Tax=Auricularia subglabra (strain TFB-10046 / SS5) TaxID=717982 RepID=J0WUG2_AURST|nr:hypothetical protein AURDEDRAFT_147021 [Auricularia subglabra TFB-10046 SS5]